MKLEKYLQNRRSIRAYLDKPVARTEIEDILIAARLAPSGANLQPGHFHVLTARPLQALSGALSEAANNGREPVSQYSYFPEPMPKTLRRRQVAAAKALYKALGIDRSDEAARAQQFLHNYAFFGAPIGIVVSIDARMGKGCFMDLGMALMALFLMVEERGLGATGIGALANYGDIVHRHLALTKEELVVCGIAIGYPDWDKSVNSVRTEREPLERYSRFIGFDAE